MDRAFMRAFYREFREHACDEAVKDSDEYKEMRDVRHKVEDELTEMLGGNIRRNIKSLMILYLHMQMNTMLCWKKYICWEQLIENGCLSNFTGTID